jgi:hypothetical protein
MLCYICAPVFDVGNSSYVACPKPSSPCIGSSLLLNASFFLSLYWYQSTLGPGLPSLPQMHCSPLLQKVKMPPSRVSLFISWVFYHSIMIVWSEAIPQMRNRYKLSLDILYWAWIALPPLHNILDLESIQQNRIAFDVFTMTITCSMPVTSTSLGIDNCPLAFLICIA